MKKTVFILLIFLSFFWLARTPALAQGEEKTLYLFWSKTCPHCAREKEFLKVLSEKYPQLVIRDFEISSSWENLELYQKVGEKLGARGGVPFTVVGKYQFVGYLDDKTTGAEIENAVQCYLNEGCSDVVAEIISEQDGTEAVSQAIPDSIDFPVIGEIKTKNLSLPALTFLVALLDGFNPCAMWVLLFLISLLLGMKERRRMWLLGSSFIVASGLTYFLFLSAWLNLFMFLGFILWVRLSVGAVALLAGGYNLRDYWVNRQGGCESVGEKKRQQIFDRIRHIVREKHFALALMGMVALAFTVNLIELVCSFGLPAIYTQVLALSKLPVWQYYLYLIFYILIFMLDDLIVFFVAMLTLKATGIQSKYARFSRLIGGILMLIVGLLLLFKPEWLTFG